jgi:myosin protein heavy chain
VRNVDRTLKDLQTQLERKEKQNTHLSDDVNRMRDKLDKLLKTIDELQASESANELSARRAERELREEKEKALRLERELEGWKSLRMEKGNGINAVGGDRGSILGGSMRSRIGGSVPWKRGSMFGPGGDGVDENGMLVDVPKRKSSIGRAPSLTKGFL